MGWGGWGVSWVGLGGLGRLVGLDFWLVVWVGLGGGVSWDGFLAGCLGCLLGLGSVGDLFEDFFC